MVDKNDLVEGYNLYKDRSGEFRWNYFTNNNIIADSGEGYVAKADALRGIEILQNSGNANTTDHT